jgi:thiamine monophosphate kinase
VLRGELCVLSPILGRSALDFALYGGEDYALLATGTARKRPKAARPIGRIESGSGVVLERESGAAEQLHGGFDHFH